MVCKHTNAAGKLKQLFASIVIVFTQRSLTLLREEPASTYKYGLELFCYLFVILLTQI